MYRNDKSGRSIELFIFDIYVALVKIRHISNDFANAQELLHDFRSWDSVIREFKIIGEASKYLLREEFLDREHQVIVDFRNQITHEYFGIDSEIVWTVIHQDLDIFEETIVRLIDSIAPDLKKELIETFIEDNHYLDFVVEALEDLKPEREERI
jgi:uncharacterized protein with HEPN domain